MSSNATTTRPGVRILFVCLGNICRSPLAEAVFRHLAMEEGSGDVFFVDSAGTGGWHVGEPPDERSVRTARRHGVDVQGTARKVSDSDFSSFDFVFAMDRANLRDLEDMGSGLGTRARLGLLREFDDQGEEDGDRDLDVPDPYYGGEDGFERVFDIVHRSCTRLLDHLRTSDAS